MSHTMINPFVVDDMSGYISLLLRVLEYAYVLEECYFDWRV